MAKLLQIKEILLEAINVTIKILGAISEVLEGTIKS